jgi:hypothetical protein
MTNRSSAIPARRALALATLRGLAILAMLWSFNQHTLPSWMCHAQEPPPKIAEANPFFPGVSHGLFTVTYPLSKAAVEVMLTPEWSTNLLTWQAGTGFQIVNVTDQITNQIVTIRAPTPAALGFFHVRVTRL